MKKLPRLKLVLQSDIQKLFDVIFDTCKKLGKATTKRNDFPGFSRKTVNTSVPQYELVANLVLSERNIGYPD